MKKQGSEPTKKLSRVDWIDGGLRLLAEGGVSSVRVEVLAKRLNVTKGSFYWHFVDRSELLSAMLEEWREQRTLVIGDLIKRRTNDPHGRLAFLLKLSTTGSANVPGGPLEHAIREWAKSSDLALRALSRVDGERLDILTSHYEALGFRPAPARARATLFLSYVIGLNILRRDLGGIDLKDEQDECRSVLLSTI